VARARRAWLLSGGLATVSIGSVSVMAESQGAHP
jgi:hypothetical protein